MSREIRRVALMLLAGFVALTAGLAWWGIVRADRLANRPGNPRIVEAAAHAERGTIWAADGTTPLVRSERGADGRNHRVYSDPSLAQTVGYVSLTYGVSGLEESFNGFLSGDRGSGAPHELWADLTRNPVRGNDIVTTINPRVQRAAAEAFGDRRGAVVALNPRTGAVLALLSGPWYDPAAIDERGDALQQDSSAPLVNRATLGQYPPGSTFKTVTGAAALDSGAYKKDATFRCPSGYVVQGFVIACKGVPDGVTQFDFAHAYAWSINASFAEIAVKTGAPSLTQVARRSGFEEEIPFDLPLATSHLLKKGASFDDLLLANTGFGQGQLSVTPMQMALVAAVIANDGVLMQPYLVQRVQRPDGTLIEERSPKQIRQAIKPETAATMKSFMTTEVREGFGGSAAIPGVEVGGKTGTAEIGPNIPTHAWFISLAPAANPTIAVAVIVENGGQGAEAAAPIAGAVMRAALGK